MRRFSNNVPMRQFSVGSDFPLSLSRPVFRMAASVCGLLLAALVVGGCASPFATNPYGLDGDIQGDIERYSKQQEQKTGGVERWEQMQADNYQDTRTLEQIREPSEEYLERIREIRQTIASKPLGLNECVVLSLEFNNEVQARRAAIRSVGGQELVVQSRFLPKLNYLLDTEQGQGVDGTGIDQIFRVSKTVLEFGRDNPDDVVLRAEQRGALFGYEDTVRQALSDVRRTFYTILVQKKQLDQRRVSLEGFQERYRKIEQLEAQHRMRGVDLLTARLNVLDEELRINALQKDIHRRKIELLRLVGLPVALADIQLDGTFADFEPGVDSAVHLALLRSTRVAQSRAAVWEQHRMARQIWWENAPDIALRAGYGDTLGESGVTLDRTDDGTYGLGGFAERRLDNPDFVDTGVFPGIEDPGWFAKLELDVPIFDGLESKGKKIREYAVLEQRRHELRDEANRVEVGVRQAYQTVLEQRENMAIQQRRVGISRERLDIQEQLKELGKISDDQLETFRDRFFSDQDLYFQHQIRLVDAQEDLRFAMRFFEPYTDVDRKDVAPQ